MTVWLRTREGTMGARSTLAPRHVSVCMSGLSRVRRSHNEWLSNSVYRVGSLQPYGRIRPDCTYTCGSFQSAYSTGQEIRAHSIGEAAMSFCKGMKQPLTDLQPLQPGKRETASEPILWHSSEDPKHVRGRCTTGTDDKTHKNRLFVLFCKKVSENWGTLWGWHKRSQTQYMVAPGSKDELNRAGHLRHKQDRKELECDPVWHLEQV